MSPNTPDARLAGFMAKYRPEVGALAGAALATMRKRLPGAVELVYDNYNALAIGFGPTERSSDAIFSIALSPHWVSLCFLQGAGLSDPHNVLKGSGKVARHVVLQDVATLDKPAVRDLMKLALAQATPLNTAAPRKIVIKSVSAKQRSRRPG